MVPVISKKKDSKITGAESFSQSTYENLWRIWHRKDSIGTDISKCGIYFILANQILKNNFLTIVYFRNFWNWYCFLPIGWNFQIASYPRWCERGEEVEFSEWIPNILSFENVATTKCDTLFVNTRWFNSCKLVPFFQNI